MEGTEVEVNRGPLAIWVAADEDDEGPIRSSESIIVAAQLHVPMWYAFDDAGPSRVHTDTNGIGTSRNSLCLW